MPTSAEKFAGPTGGHKPKAKPKVVAGPYRSQSSNKKIRSEATSHEHRKVKPRKAVRAKQPPSSAAAVRAALADIPAQFKPKNNPHFTASAAKSGAIPPPESLKHYHPRAYENQKLAYISKHEGLKEDPLAELAISTAATAGVGGLASLAGKAGSKGAAAVGARLLSSEATVGESAAEKALKEAVTKATESGRVARTIAKVKAAPRATVERVKGAPKAARTAVRTKAGREQLLANEARRLEKAGRSASKRPIRYSGAGNAAAYPLGAHTSATKRANAYVEGTIKGFANDPLKTVGTTGRAALGIVTGPLALAESAASSAVHGTPRPFEEEAAKQIKGVVQIGGKLFSGNSAEVQKAVEDEVGLSFVAPFPALSRVKELEIYKDARGGLRARVASYRDLGRAKRRQELEEFKAGDRSRPPRKPRYAVRDTATGEERIFRRTGKVLEGHRQRKRVSIDTAREKARGDREAILASKPVIKSIRRSKLAKGQHNVGDVLATVAQYGISRDREKAMRQLDEIEASIGHHHPDEIPAGTITDLQNIKWMREHPAMFEDKHFWEAVDAYKRQAKEIETSGRKKVLAVGDVYGLARPEERLEAGVDVGGRRVESHFYKEPEAIQRKQAELSELRRDAAIVDGFAKVAKTKERRAKTAELATEIAARAKKLERELKDYRDGLRQATKDYVREAQATIAEKGLEQPAYVKDVKPRQGLKAEPAFPGGRSAVKQHMAGGSARARGIAARDFETLINQSVGEPRMRRSLHRATTDFVAHWAQPVAGKRYLTSSEIERAINRGELDESQFAVLHSQSFKQAILDPHKEAGQFLNDIRGPLDRGMKGEIARRAADSGHKYVVVPKEALREFVHQMEPPKGLERIFGKANRFLTRLMLGFSPSWAIAQLLAEGIPAAVSIGASPTRWARVMQYMAQEDRKLGKEDRAAIDAVVGESPGITPHPQTQFRVDTNLMASRFLRLAEGNPVGRSLLAVGKGDVLGFLDRWKGGKYRKAVAAAKADRQLNGFVTSLGELWRGQRTIIEAIKGKPLGEQMGYIAKHPAEAAKLEGYLDNVMGNWRALTRHEAKLAPLVVFYPFLRYSLRWTFWAFPKEHPIKAQILYFLAQQNAEELEKLAGGPLTDPLGYAFAVYTNSHGEDAVAPGGQRIAPGLNSITQAIGKGNVESLASALNPAIGIAGAGVYGVDAYTGEKVAKTPLEHALLAGNQLLSTFAPTRYAGLNELGQEQSYASKVFAQHDPEKQNRSIWNPFAPQSGTDFRASQVFARALQNKYAHMIPGLPSEYYEVAAAHDWKRAKEILSENKRSEAAGNVVKAFEKPFYGKGGIDDEGSEILAYMTGHYEIPAEITPPVRGRMRKARRVRSGIGGGPTGSGIGGGPTSTGIGGGPTGSGIGGGP
jgi:hypothetical protein